MPSPKPPILLAVDAVILAVADETPLVLTLRARSPADKKSYALPSGPFDPVQHRTLEESIRARIFATTGLEVGYVEQLYTFADRYRDPQELSGGPRRVSVGYLALVPQAPATLEGDSEWIDLYEFLPWEDCRSGRHPIIDSLVLPRLRDWIDKGPEPTVQRSRRDRLAVTFPSGGEWDPMRALDRFELLYECDLAAEAQRDAWHRAALAAMVLGASAVPATAPAPPTDLGCEMVLDHRRMLATALARLRGKLDYRPVIFELLPRQFTLYRLQRVAEALAGIRLHKQNFRRLVINGGLVEPVGKLDQRTGGRPAALYRFRRDVLRERPAPGVGLPLFRAD